MSESRIYKANLEIKEMVSKSMKDADLSLREEREFERELQREQNRVRNRMLQKRVKL